MSKKRDVPGVIAPPPLILLFFLVGGLALDRWWPLLDRLPSVEVELRWFAGGVFLLLSVLIAVLSVGGFRRAGTPVPTGEPVSALVTRGMHGLSRNPIYLGFFLFQAGIALVVNSWGMMLLLPLLVLVLRYGVVAREEAYLERKFGDAYEAYRRRVPRWL